MSLARTICGHAHRPGESQVRRNPEPDVDAGAEATTELTDGRSVGRLAVTSYSRTTATTLLRLQSLAGNRAIVRQVAVQRRDPTGVAQRRPGPQRKKRQPAPKRELRIPEHIDSPAQLGQVLAGGGVAANRMGDLAAAFALPERQRLLNDLATPEGLVIIPGWNRGADDLTADHYPTILHYLRELDRLSEKTMNIPRYVLAVAQMPTVTLAGVAVKINPRALYFAAAFQVEMDEEANRTAGTEQMGVGKGHFAAVPAMIDELKRIGADAKTFVTERTKSAGKGRKTVLPAGASALYEHLRERLATVYDRVDSEQVQLEPDFQKYLERKRSAFSPFLEKKPSNDEEAFLAIGALAVAIGRGRELNRLLAHGYGSLGDRHGTMHAIGLAIDLFYSRKGAPTNLKKRSQPYLPFIAYVAAAYGEGEIPSDPSGWVELLSDDNVQAALKDIDRGVSKQERKTIREYRAILAGKVLPPLRRVRAAVSAVRPAKAPPDVRDEITASTAQARAKLDAAILLLPRSGTASVPEPEPVRTALYEAHDAVADLLKLDPGRWRASLDRSKDAPVLQDLAEYLTDVSESIAIDEKRIRAADAVRRRKAFMSWLADARTQERAAWDQPAEITAASRRVKVADLQGWHHWQVGALVHLDLGEYFHGERYRPGRRPGRNVIEAYRSALEADMQSRPKEQMRKIITTMAETPGGRRALWGTWRGKGDPPPAGDPALGAALARWAVALAPESERPVDLPELMRKAYEPIATAEDRGATGLVQNLIAHGHYTIAETLVKGKQPAPPEAQEPAPEASKETQDEAPEASKTPPAH